MGTQITEMVSSTSLQQEETCGIVTVLELTNCGTKQEIRHFHTRLTWLYEADLEEHIKEHLVQQMKPVRQKEGKRERNGQTERLYLDMVPQFSYQVHQ